MMFWKFYVVLCLLIGGFKSRTEAASVPCKHGDCNNTKDPVCGTDNRTYENLCELRKVHCYLDPALGVLHQGECYNALGREMRARHCNTNCPLPDPVCGTDGRTYSSECVMELVNCRLMDQHVLVKYRGPCT